MPAIGNFLSDLATRFGINISSVPAFESLASSDLNIPDEVATLFNVELMTMDAALNNPRIKAKFRSDILDPVDTDIRNMINDFNLPTEARTEILGEPSTYKRVQLIAKKIRDVESQKATATSSRDKNELESQLQNLQADLQRNLQQHQTELSSRETGWNTKFIDLLKNNIVSRKQLDTSKFPLDVMHDLATASIDKALSEKGVKFVIKNDKLALVQTQDETMDYVVNNTTITPESFIDSVLADKKLIAVSMPAPPQPGNPGPSPMPGRNYPPSPRQVPAGNLSRFDKAMADYQAHIS